MFPIRSQASVHASAIEPGGPRDAPQAEVAGHHDELPHAARRQEHFLDDVHLTPAQVMARPTYGDCRCELFWLFRWLRNELMAVPALEDLAGSIGRCPLRWCLLDDTPLSEAHLPMFGPGKRRMHELCLALEANPGPAARIAAAAPLRRIFFDGSSPTADAVDVLSQALAAVRLRDTPSETTSETVRRWQENEDGIRNRMHAALDRLGVIAKRGGFPFEAAERRRFTERFLTAPSGGQDDWVGHMQRFGIDRLEQVLDRLSLPGLSQAQEKRVVESLTQALRSEKNPAAQIQFIALYELPQMSRSHEQDEWTREQTIRREIEAKATARWPAMPPRQRSKRIDDEFLEVADRLGFDAVEGGLRECNPPELLDLSSDGLIALLDRIEQAIAKDRALIAAPARAVAPARRGVIQRWADGQAGMMQRLFDATDTLRAAAIRHGVEIGDSIDRFTQRFLVAPTGDENDPVGNFQLFGLEALERLCTRIQGHADRERVAQTLTELMGDLATEPELTGQLLKVLRYRLRQPEFSPAEHEAAERARLNVVAKEVRGSAAVRLKDLPAHERESRIESAQARVKHLLGFADNVGGYLRPTAEGVFDTSAVSLHALLEKTRDAASSAMAAHRARH